MNEWNRILADLMEYNTLNARTQNGLSIRVEELEEQLKEARKQAFLEAAEMIEEMYKRAFNNNWQNLYLAKRLREKADEEI